MFTKAISNDEAEFRLFSSQLTLGRGGRMTTPFPILTRLIFHVFLAWTGRISRWLLRQRTNRSVLTHTYAFHHLWNCQLSPPVIIIVSSERGLICDRIASLQWSFYSYLTTVVAWLGGEVRRIGPVGWVSVISARKTVIDRRRATATSTSLTWRYPVSQQRRFSQLTGTTYNWISV